VSERASEPAGTPPLFFTEDGRERASLTKEGRKETESGPVGRVTETYKDVPKRVCTHLVHVAWQVPDARFNSDSNNNLVVRQKQQQQVLLRPTEEDAAGHVLDDDDDDDDDDDRGGGGHDQHGEGVAGGGAAGAEQGARADVPRTQAQTRGAPGGGERGDPTAAARRPGPPRLFVGGAGPVRVGEPPFTRLDRQVLRQALGHHGRRRTAPTINNLVSYPPSLVPVARAASTCPSLVVVVVVWSGS